VGFSQPGRQYVKDYCIYWITLSSFRSFSKQEVANMLSGRERREGGQVRLMADRQGSVAEAVRRSAAAVVAALAYTTSTGTRTATPQFPLEAITERSAPTAATKEAEAEEAQFYALSCSFYNMVGGDDRQVGEDEEEDGLFDDLDDSSLDDDSDGDEEGERPPTSRQRARLAGGEGDDEVSMAAALSQQVSISL
jgi:hypothetical protein